MVSEPIGVFEHATGGITLAHVIRYEWRFNHAPCGKDESNRLAIISVESASPALVIAFEIRGESYDRTEAESFIQQLHLYWETRR